jgi:hypothetical protein
MKSELNIKGVVLAGWIPFNKQNSAELQFGGLEVKYPLLDPEIQVLFPSKHIF